MNGSCLGAIRGRWAGARDGRGEDMNGKYWDLPWSLVDGCTPCSPGCEHCWSASIDHRFRSQNKDDARYLNDRQLTTPNGKFNGLLRLHPDRLSIPLKRRKPTVYAVWNDLFHEAVPDEFRVKVYFAMNAAPQHTYLILTKRPIKMGEFVNTFGTDCPIENGEKIYHGLSVCNQQEADEKIPIFLHVPGKKFLSIEPMLSEIHFRWKPYHHEATGETYRQYLERVGSIDHLESLKGIECVICGGETGPGARPMHPDWVRSVRDQCAGAGVTFFFKGWGAWKPCDDDHVECAGHKNTAMRLNGEVVTDESPIWKDKAYGGPDQGFWKAGSKAGRLLDGRTHDDLPWRAKP